MKHANSILGIGIVLVLIPILGFPPTWNRFFIIILGLCLCFVVVKEKYGDKLSAVLLRRKKDFSAKTGHASSHIASSDMPKSSEPTNIYDQTPTV
jgi:hypothetical protein